MELTVDIEKRLGNFHLRANFTVQMETFALLGASGCGKSMTLKCIAGIERPDRGSIILDGQTLFDREKHINLPLQKRKVGYLFQQYALFPNMSAEQNIRCALPKQMTREEKKRQLEDLVRRFRLEGLERKLPSQLSGGQQQRVALARILAARRPSCSTSRSPHWTAFSNGIWRRSSVRCSRVSTAPSYGFRTILASAAATAAESASWKTAQAARCARLAI